MFERFLPASARAGHQSKKVGSLSRAIGSVLQTLEPRRLLSADTLDTSFGGTGLVVTDFGGSDIGAIVAVQSDGKILAAGSSDSGGVIIRYNEDGTPDAGFGTNADGKVSLSGLGLETVSGMAVWGDKIVLVGENSGFNGDFAVARLNADGSPDGSLNAGFVSGARQVNLGTVGFVARTDVPVAVAVRADGTIVVAGTSTAAGLSDFAVLQLLPDGSSDNSFDGDGISFVDFGSSGDTCLDMVLQSDGKVLLVGSTTGIQTEDAALARLTATGSPDITFGTGGKVVTGEVTLIERLNAVTVTADSIYTAGFFNFDPDNEGEWTGILLRYDMDGVLDADFGGTGGTLPAGFVEVPGAKEDTSDVIVDADDKILVSGFPSTFKFSLTRFNDDGTPDATFGTNGNVQLSDSSTFDLATRLALYDDGRIVVGGTVDLLGDADFGVARFGEAGGGGDEFGEDVVVAMDGTNLIITGSVHNDNVVITNNSSGVQVNANGQVVGTFGPTGQIIIKLGPGNDRVNTAASMTIPMFVDGGEGNDTIKGGGGNDILVGGSGDDRLMGAGGRDLIIGGSGADRILGHQDDDILIAGFTAHDGDLEALNAIMDEWASLNSYTVRVDNLRNGTGLNGLSVLVANSTVFDDDAADSLTGNSGTDWFLFNDDEDVATDINVNEFGDELL